MLSQKSNGWFALELCFESVICTLFCQKFVVCTNLPCVLFWLQITDRGTVGTEHDNQILL